MIARTIATLSLALVCVSAFAVQTTPPAPAPKPEISISAKGKDVREVIAEAFAQADQPFVIEPNVRGSIYLSIKGVSLEKVITMIARAADLQFRVEEGVTIFAPKPATKPVTAVVAPAQAMPATLSAPKSTGTLSTDVLARRLTTKLAKKDIRSVIIEFGRQTGIKIEVDKSVPAFRVDAFLKATSLKYALDQVTEAAGLEYRFTNQLSILVTKAADGRITQN